VRAVVSGLLVSAFAALATLALGWLAARGVDADSVRVTPAGPLYVTRAVAVMYGLAALPLALLVAQRLSRRLPSGALLVASILAAGATAWFWFAAGPAAVLGRPFFRTSSHETRVLARCAFALVTVLPWCVFGWSFARAARGPEPGPALPVVSGIPLALLFTLFLVGAPHGHDRALFGTLVNQATNALPDLYYAEAETQARRLQLLGGDAPSAGMPLARFRATLRASGEACRTQMQQPETLRELLQRFPLMNPLLSLGRYDEAEADIEAALARDPRHPRALLDRARLARLRDEDWEDTRARFAEAVDAARGRAGKPVLVRALSGHADACYRTQDLQRAEALYLEALEVEESAQLHLDLARVYQRQGRARLGSKHARRAMELQPEARAAAMGTLSGMLQGSFDCAPALAGW
jgi:tetratricopeptide (TPR) repeat protein